ESIRLLGQPGADELDDGGDLLVRVDARAPVEARGFRVAPEHLDQLAQLMGDAYPSARSMPPTPAPDAAGDAAAAGEPEPEGPEPAVDDEPTVAGQAVDLFGTPLTARVDGPATNGNGNGHHPAARPGNGRADRASEQPANQN